MPIHKCIGCGEPGSQEELSSREETRPDLTGGSQGLTGSLGPSQPILGLALLIIHTSHTSLEVLHRGKGAKTSGFFFFFKMFPCLNNDVGIRSRGG